MKLLQVGNLPTGPVNGSWFRAVNQLFAAKPLAFRHSKRHRTRFNPGGILGAPLCETIYFSESHATCLAECRAQFWYAGQWHTSPPLANISWMIGSMSVTLSHVIDLSNTATQQTLGTSAQCLTGDWEGYSRRSPQTTVQLPVGAAPTQKLGWSAFQATNVEGLIYVSSKEPVSKCLVVFPRKLVAGSSITYLDAQTRKTHTMTAAGKTKIT